MWTCPECESEVDEGFDVCWQCGTSPDGTEDPLFETADDSGPIRDEVEDDQFAPLDEIEEEFGEQLPDLVEVFEAEGVAEARFVADQLRLNGIPAVSDRRNINIEALGGFIPSAWGHGPRVRVRPEDSLRALAWVEEFQKRRRNRLSRDDEIAT